MAEVGDILRIVASMVLDIGVTVQNVYHVQITGPSNPGDAVVVEDMGEYLEDIYTELLDELPASMTFDEYSVQNITADISLGTTAWPSLTVGNNVSDTLPTGDAGLLLARTSKPGHHGSKYFGPLSEASVDGGQCNGVCLGRLFSAGGKAYDSPWESTNDIEYEPGILDSELGILRPVVSLEAQPDIAYQRRRRPGRGI
jgi:hypothetical protein